MTRRYRWWLALTLAGLAGCASPEATRVRGAARADLGNHDRVAELHAGAKIYFRTPCRTVKREMHWPHARHRRPRNLEIQERVAVARRDKPRVEAWLGLLEAALGESEEAPRGAAVPTPARSAPSRRRCLSQAQIR